MESNSPFKPLNRFVFRTPLFPSNASSYTELINDELFREAIYLATPSLYEALSKVDSSDFSSLPDKVRMSLFKYIIRITCRPTPFGLFAGCGTGEVKELEPAGITIRDDRTHGNSYISRVRLDMDFLCRLISELNEDKELQEELRYFANNSGYIFSGTFRYIESRYIDGSKRLYLSEVENSPYLRFVLDCCRRDGCTKAAILRQFLREFPDIMEEEVRQYIDSAIADQVIVSELQPSLTAGDAFEQIRGTTSLRKPVLSPLLNELGRILDVLNAGAGGRIALYQHIALLLEDHKMPYEKKYLFQSDIALTATRAVVNADITAQVSNAIALLNKLTPYMPDALLEKFKNDFYSRYEDEEVPLVNVFDPDMGIGFSNYTAANTGVSPLIDGLGFLRENARVAQMEAGVARTWVEKLLFRKYRQALNERLVEITLTEDDVRGIKETWTDLPDSLATVIQLKELDNKPVIIMRAASGSSAANLLARFGDVDDEIRDIVAEIVEKEKALAADNEVVAEIVHLPQNRLGNVMCRLVSRDYEIPYLARSAADQAHTLAIDDLLVSIRDQRIRLRSRRLNKFVKPKNTNAHNYAKQTLPIYHFLNLMQADFSRHAVYFSWGSLENEPFLPRVRYKEVILSPATWNIGEEDWSAYDLSGDDSSCKEAFFQLMKDKGLPPMFSIAEGDNKLLIDANNHCSIRLLIDECRGKKTRLEEYIMDGRQPFASGLSGDPYNAEVILCFVRH